MNSTDSPSRALHSPPHVTFGLEVQTLLSRKQQSGQCYSSRAELFLTKARCSQEKRATLVFVDEYMLVHAGAASDT